MKSIPESVLQQQPTNYSPRAKWGPPSISMYLALKQRIVFRFLKVGGKKNVNRDSLWPAKPKIFTLDPFQKKFADPWCTEWMSVNVCMCYRRAKGRNRERRDPAILEQRSTPLLTPRSADPLDPLDEVQLASPQGTQLHHLTSTLRALSFQFLPVFSGPDPHPQCIWGIYIRNILGTTNSTGKL